MNSIILSDIFFKLNLVESCFSFLKDKYKCEYDYTLNPKKHLSYNMIIGWGSGCLSIFENIENLKSDIIVLISPYLDFDRFFSWFESCENYENIYFKKSGIKNSKFYRYNVDLKYFKGKKVFLKPSMEIKNLNIFIGEKDEIINPEDSLKLDFFFKSSSIHYLEGMGFAPFYESQNTFKEIFKEYII